MNWQPLHKYAPHLLHRARAALARLELLGAGSTAAWNASGSGKPGSKPPTGNTWPLSEAQQRLTDAQSTREVLMAIEWAEKTAKNFKKGDPDNRPQGEDEQDRRRRVSKELVTDGQGVELHEASRLYGLSVSEVRSLRVAANQFVSDGRSVSEVDVIGDKPAQARILREQAWSTREIARRLGVHQTQVVRWTKDAA